MVAPLHPTPLSFNIAIGVLGAVQSIITDMILLIRLVSVYPPSFVGMRLFSIILLVPVLLKVARIINLCLFIKALADATRDPATANILIGQIWEHAPYLKIEWFAQLFDNSYVQLRPLRVNPHTDEASADTHQASSSTACFSITASPAAL